MKLMLCLHIGFDGAVHMGEEVRSAKAAIPRSIFYTVAINSVLAYTIIVTVLFTMGPLDSALNSGSKLPLIEIVRQATGSIKATTAMVSGLLVISLSVNSACIASSSRLTWAWSRDGGLPVWFSVVCSIFLICLINPRQSLMLTNLLT